MSTQIKGMDKTFKAFELLEKYKQPDSELIPIHQVIEELEWAAHDLSEILDNASSTRGARSFLERSDRMTSLLMGEGYVMLDWPGRITRGERK